MISLYFLKLAKSLSIEVDPKFDQQIKEQAINAAKKYVNELSDSESFKVRYKLILKKVDKYWSEQTFEFEIFPKSIDMSIGREKNNILFKSPKNAIETIRQNSSYVYRGMSYEEWKNIKSSGFIKSKGSYNFDFQKGLTFFSDNPSTALSYASGFSPMQYKPSHNRPAVIIAIDKSLCLSNNDSKTIGENEYASKEPISINEIKEVYYLIPIEIRIGEIQIIVNTLNQSVSQGSGMHPDIYYSIIKQK